VSSLFPLSWPRHRPPRFPLIYGFNVASTETTTLGNFPGDSCSFSLIGLNGSAEVLALANNCTQSDHDGSVTWDAKHGFLTVASGLPKNKYDTIDPVWLNDRGEILVELTSAADHIGEF